MGVGVGGGGAPPRCLALFVALPGVVAGVTAKSQVL